MSSKQSPFIVRVVGDLKLLAVYTCSKCQARKKGETKRISIDVITPEEARIVIGETDLRQQFPIGWGSFEDGLRCEACLSKMKQN